VRLAGSGPAHGRELGLVPTAPSPPPSCPYCMLGMQLAPDSLLKLPCCMFHVCVLVSIFWSNQSFTFVNLTCCTVP
jgi:hypothetical protein